MVRQRTLSPKTQKARDEFNQAVEKYLSIFGEHSLDRVILGDPLDESIEGFSEPTRILRDAIRKNEPLEQVSPEMWKNIIF